MQTWKGLTWMVSSWTRWCWGSFCKAFFTTDVKPSTLCLPANATERTNHMPCRGSGELLAFVHCLRKGEDTNPANYRQLAIGSVFFRYVQTERTRWGLRNNGGNGFLCYGMSNLSMPYISFGDKIATFSLCCIVDRTAEAGQLWGERMPVLAIVM
jgi:hypothetical protein